jgi:23S rRNA pseudouridine1911/1915/1917 synthase
MSDTTKTLRSNEYRVTHSVGANQSGIRLDRFLMDRYHRRSREQLKKAIESGAVTIQRESAKHLTLGKIKASFALQAGDIVQVLSRRNPEPEVNFNYKTLYEDDEILVIHKPPNLPVHPAGRFFFNTLLIHLKTDGFKEDLKAERNYYLVHRIDKETSGILLLAKTKEACNLLTAQFRDRITDKYYLAIVRGKPKQTQFDITTSIGKIPGSKVGLKMYPKALDIGGLTAETHFEWIESRSHPDLGTFSLMACFPRTGRQHQIRVHADIAGHPLVGDKIYGMTDEEVLTLLDGHREDMTSDVSPDPAIQETESEILAEIQDTQDFEIEPFSREDETERYEIPGPTSTRYAEIESRLLLPRHALHAAGLRFTHPKDGRAMIFEASLPEDLEEFFVKLDGKPFTPFKTKHW